jgi:hypothetical protein
MIVYEYKRIYIDLSPEEQQVMDIGLIPGLAKELDAKVEEAINEQGLEGWEAMYPFSLPCLWLRKTKTVRKNAKNG